jgi:hypothetical protein
MVVLREEIGREYDSKYDDGAYQMSPGVNGLVVPFK